MGHGRLNNKGFFSEQCCMLDSQEIWKLNKKKGDQKYRENWM